MRSKSAHLYLSGSTWVAVRRGLASAVWGVHGDPSSGDWAQVGRSLVEAFGRPARIRLVLSTRLCPCLVVPWVSSRFTASAVRDHVVDAFLHGPGVTAASHRIEAVWPRFGRPILAVAYPRGLVDEVAAGLAESGCLVDAVVASLHPVLRRYGTASGCDSSLLAFAEDDGITGITMDGGQVTQVETLSGWGGGLEDAALWLARKRFGFEDDSALRWLATGDAPEGFVGKTISVGASGSPVSPGHGVLAACA
ncbi:hypothetical protein H0E84_02075 [Luteimonas sp. SJ-92]|uniref:Uncharacterized protein n=1 Tax=Luteimonas salinisoli TaxID=2752307 RepID=A0A853J8Y5_9GAMM|nr:hypothetical protein [Luteimonas salinisoli]NZA25158.1 hypothetical protein [Luteimonas salinisoli]